MKSFITIETSETHGLCALQEEEGEMEIRGLLTRLL